MKAQYLNLAAFAIMAALGLGACSSSHDHEHGDMDHHDHGDMMHHGGPGMPMEQIHEAVAVVYPTKGNAVSGAIYFSAAPDGIHVHGQVSGLEPNSVHAIHIHQFGDQTSDDGMSAGGHFNPEGHKHGGPESAEHHAGDLGNLQADASGVATMDLTVHGVTIGGMKDNILGRGLVIHAKADDLVSQPVGNAGGRIGVGVIGVAKVAAPAPK